MEADIKLQIDNMSYIDMLHKWRFQPIGSTLFQGEVGAYFVESMNEKRKKVGPAGHTSASKAIGWDNPN